MFDTEVSTALYRHTSISLTSIIVPTLVDEQTGFQRLSGLLQVTKRKNSSQLTSARIPKPSH